MNRSNSTVFVRPQQGIPSTFHQSSLEFLYDGYVPTLGFLKVPDALYSGQLERQFNLPHSSTAVLLSAHKWMSLHGTKWVSRNDIRSLCAFDESTIRRVLKSCVTAGLATHRTVSRRTEYCFDGLYVFLNSKPSSRQIAHHGSNTLENKKDSGSFDGQIAHQQVGELPTMSYDISLQSLAFFNALLYNTILTKRSIESEETDSNSSSIESPPCHLETTLRHRDSEVPPPHSTKAPTPKDPVSSIETGNSQRVCTADIIPHRETGVNPSSSVVTSSPKNHPDSLCRPDSSGVSPKESQSNETSSSQTDVPKKEDVSLSPPKKTTDELLEHLTADGPTRTLLDHLCIGTFDRKALCTDASIHGRDHQGIFDALTSAVKFGAKNPVAYARKILRTPVTPLVVKTSYDDAYQKQNRGIQMRLMEEHAALEKHSWAEVLLAQSSFSPSVALASSMGIDATVLAGWISDATDITPETLHTVLMAVKPVAAEGRPFYQVAGAFFDRLEALQAPELAA